jgi:type II secretory pathway component GspD/PulD (secretin)
LLALRPALLSAQARLPLPDETLLDVQPGERGVPEPAKLAIYKPKHIPAGEAAALVQGLMGESANVLVEPTGNQLVIRAPEPAIKEIQAVLKELDQPPRQIAFEVLFADLPASADAPEPKEHANSTDAWLERLKGPEAQITGNISKIRLTATENQKAMVQFGGQTPVVAGVQQAFGGRGGGGRSPIIQQTSTGTIVQCTARMLGDDTIIAELEIERSRLAPESGALLEENDNGELRTPGMLTTTCKTTVKLKPGKASVISGQKSKAGKGNTLNLIVITAELVSPGE